LHDHRDEFQPPCPSTAPVEASRASGSARTCTCNSDIDHLINVLQLGNLSGLRKHRDHGERPLCNDRDVDDLVDELQKHGLQQLSTTTGIPQPVQELHLWNLHGLQQLSTTTGIPLPVQELHLCSLHGLKQLSLNTTGMSTTLSMNWRTATIFSTTATVGAVCLLHDWHRRKPVRSAQQGQPPCQHTATGESLWSSEQTEPWGSASAPRKGC